MRETGTFPETRVEKEPLYIDEPYKAIAAIVEGKGEVVHSPQSFFADYQYRAHFKPDGKVVIAAYATHANEADGPSVEYDPEGPQNSTYDMYVTGMRSVIDRTREVYAAMTEYQHSKFNVEEIAEAITRAMYFEDFIAQQKLREEKGEGEYYDTPNTYFLQEVTGKN